MVYHLTVKPKALNAPAGHAVQEAICGAILYPKDAIICAIMLSDHDAGDTHFLHRELCEYCKGVADSRSMGIYRCDARALKDDRQ